MTGRRVRRVAIAALTGLAVHLFALPVAAQETPLLDQPEERRVVIGFDVGEFDMVRGDWRVDAVLVSGDLDEETPVTIEVLGAGDIVLWSGTDVFTGPETRIEVVPFVAVGDVVSAGVAQQLAQVAGVQIEPPQGEVFRRQAGGAASGQLALAMILTVIVVAIVFRSPMPSATAERWTK